MDATFEVKPDGTILIQIPADKSWDGAEHNAEFPRAETILGLPYTYFSTRENGEVFLLLARPEDSVDMDIDSDGLKEGGLKASFERDHIITAPPTRINRAMCSLR